MADYKIDATDDVVAIQLTGVGERRDALLQAFGECQQGRCSCPTDEYEKVATMDVQPSSDRIDIRLEAKPGTRLDPAELEACLDHTVRTAR